MDSVGTIAREQGRRDSRSDIGGNPISAGQVPKKSATSGAGHVAGVLSMGARQPATLSTQATLGLRETAPDAQRNIAKFLTFRQAICLMLVSRRIHPVIRGELKDIIAAFNGLYSSIQSTEAEISALELARMTPNMPVLRVTFAGISINVPKQLATRALQEKEKHREVEALEQIETRKASLRVTLDALEAQVEPLWLHFESERSKGPSAAGASNATTVPEIKPREKIQSRIHSAINNGDAELVRTELRNFLSVPTPLLPNAKKIARLRELPGQDTLKVIGQRRCGTLQDAERRQYDAVIAYVDEIVSSDLAVDEKNELCLKREGISPDADLVRYASRQCNPAFAACILLGIQESSAEPDDKHHLLTAIAAAWVGGLESCIDSICDSLRLYDHRAPDWVNERIARLKSMKPER